MYNNDCETRRCKGFRKERGLAKSTGSSSYLKRGSVIHIYYVDGAD